MPTPTAPAANAAIVAACARVLRPLVRLLIRHGISYPALAETLKAVYVRVADDHFSLPGKTATDSRISLLTGVHRKDVRRLRLAAQDPPSPGVSLGAQVAARWAGDARYRDAAGQPAPLARLARDGGEASFEALVAGVNRDIRPRAVLDEWLRQGAVTLDAQDRVHLVAGAFVPAQGLEEKSWYLGRNVHDHLAAAVHNLGGGTPAQFERCVWYDGLSPAAVEELAALARAEGMRALQAVNTRALALQEAGVGADDSTGRMSFGAYFHTPIPEEPIALPADAHLKDEGRD